MKSQSRAGGKSSRAAQSEQARKNTGATPSTSTVENTQTQAAAGAAAGRPVRSEEDFRAREAAEEINGAKDAAAALFFLLVASLDKDRGGKPSGAVVDGIQTLSWHVNEEMGRNLAVLAPAALAKWPDAEAAINQAAALLYLLTDWFDKESRAGECIANGVARLYVHVVASLVETAKDFDRAALLKLAGGTVKGGVR